MKFIASNLSPGYNKRTGEAKEVIRGLEWQLNLVARFDGCTTRRWCGELKPGYTFTKEKGSTERLFVACVCASCKTI